MTPLERLQKIQTLHSQRKEAMKRKRKWNATAVQLAYKINELVEETETDINKKEKTLGGN